MGARITQRIYTSDHCNTEPKDGTTMWEMWNNGRVYICEYCFDEWQQEEIAHERRLRQLRQREPIKPIQ